MLVMRSGLSQVWYWPCACMALIASQQLLRLPGWTTWCARSLQPVGLDGLPLTEQPKQKFGQVVKDMAKNMGQKSL